MTPNDAISAWRKMTQEEYLAARKEFRDALDEAVKQALKSADPAARFWEVDAAGWEKKQFNVKVMPKLPLEHDAFGQGATEEYKRKYTRKATDPYPTY